MSMFAPPKPPDEIQRLADLRALSVLDTPAERRFDNIVSLTKHLFKVPVAYIALVDAERQWFKSIEGYDWSQTPRDTSFCGHTILQGEPLIVEDAHADPRWADHPMVVNEPFVRFYAGYPLRSQSGRNIATLCVVDHEARAFTEDDQRTFAHLAAMAEVQLNLTDVISGQQDLIAARRRLQAELDEAAAYVRAFLPPREVALHAPERPDYQFIASSRLGGDMLGFYALDDEHFVIYLLDVTGHGVGSSLLSVSAANAVRGISRVGASIDPAALLTSLNKAFPMEEHRNKFFTIWYGVYHRPSRTLRYATAGHHPALLYRPGPCPQSVDPEDPAAPPTSFANTQQHCVEHLGHPALMIGVVPDAEFQTHEVTLQPGDRLYLFSDGLFEVHRGDQSGKLLGLDGLEDLIGQPYEPDRTRVSQIIQRVREVQQKSDFVDDVSLLEIEFACTESPAPIAKSSAAFA